MAARARPVAAPAGAEDDIMEYVKRIRSLRWLAMALRAQETAQVRGRGLRLVAPCRRRLQQRRWPLVWVETVQAVRACMCLDAPASQLCGPHLGVKGMSSGRRMQVQGLCVGYA
jgi:hypothetical protein